MPPSRGRSTLCPAETLRLLLTGGEPGVASSTTTEPGMTGTGSRPAGLEDRAPTHVEHRRVRRVRDLQAEKTQPLAQLGTLGVRRLGRLAVAPVLVLVLLRLRGGAPELGVRLDQAPQLAQRTGHVEARVGALDDLDAGAEVLERALVVARVVLLLALEEERLRLLSLDGGGLRGIDPRPERHVGRHERRHPQEQRDGETIR